MTAGRTDAASLARIALGHVSREWPHALQHVWTGPLDGRTPREWHPVFFGSFDWHSCVHGYWLLASCLRRDPEVAGVRELFDARLTTAAVAAECAYFARPTARGFERPYGWAWVLALHYALRGFRWAASVRPLAEVVAARLHAYLPLARYPVRVGTHFNTAFALRVAAPWADANDPLLAALLRDKAREWYAGDAACQAWEPGQDEFLSPALMEAACMRRLHPEGFAAWFARFLPERAQGRPETLFTPAQVSDRSDGKIAHLDGLNLSRAWCWREVAGDPAALAAADAHEAAALPAIEGDFMGEHWLASFAALAAWPGVLEA